MRRDDPVDEPWYEIDFRMTRWRCPEGLSGPLLDDIVEAIQETDRLLLDSIKMVDSYAYGFDSSPKRYVRYSQIEHLKADFEEMEDRLLIAKQGLARRLALVMATHSKQVACLPKETQRSLENAAGDYRIEFETVEVEVNDTLKQFLEGIQSGN